MNFALCVRQLSLSTECIYVFEIFIALVAVFIAGICIRLAIDLLCFSPKKKRAPLFVVIGNIGSGKSTVVDRIHHAFQKDGCYTISEPVDDWEECGFSQSFYSEMKKYAFAFQMFAFATRARLYKAIRWDKILFCVADGHVISDRNVFAESLMTSGFITPKELEWYNKTYDGWEQIVPEMRATQWIYLRSSPQICLSRIQKRGREEEKNISLEYLQGLHHLFEKMSTNPKYSSEMRILDADREGIEVYRDMAQILWTNKKIRWSPFRSMNVKWGS